MESLDSTQVNIKDLVTEMPDKETRFYFDPEKEITMDDCVEIEPYLQDTIEPAERWSEFCECRGILKMFIPDDSSSRGSPIHAMDDFIWNKIEGELENFERLASAIHYFTLLYAIKQYDVERFKTIVVSPTMRLQLRNNFPITPVDKQLALQWQWRVLFPSTPFPVPQTPQDEQLRWGKVLQKFHAPPGASPLSSDGELLEFASAVKLACPERFHELGTTKEQFQSWHQQFIEARQCGKWETFLHYAFPLTVLSAQTIEFTNHGLRLVNKPPQTTIKECTPPIPEVRHF